MIDLKDVIEKIIFSYSKSGRKDWKSLVEQNALEELLYTESNGRVIGNRLRVEKDFYVVEFMVQK